MTYSPSNTEINLFQSQLRACEAYAANGYTEPCRIN